MSKKAPASEPEKLSLSQEISLQEAAELMGISYPLARKIVGEGHVQRSARGRVRLGDWGRGYAAYRDAGDKRSTKSASTSRVSDARATEIEQRIAERNRHLVPTEEATAAIDHIVAACAEAFAALPAMLTRNIEERKRIETQVKRAQGEVAKRLAEAARVLREGGKLPDAD